MYEQQHQEDRDYVRICNDGQRCGCRLGLWRLMVICDIVAIDDDDEDL